MDRLPHYDAARDRLIAIGRLYPCYETPEELEFKRKRLLSQGRPPIYDRAALKLGDADRARLEGEGRRPHWRFKLATEEMRWDDLVRGPQHIDEASPAIRCWCAPTAISTASPRWSTISRSTSPT